MDFRRNYGFMVLLKKAILIIKETIIYRQGVISDFIILLYNFTKFPFIILFKRNK